MLIEIVLSLVVHPTPALAADGAVHKDCFTKPCEIRGDFDGDKKIDIATLVANTKELKGVQIQLANHKTYIVGAGAAFGNGGSDFSWMDVWNLHHGKIERGATDEAPPVAKGDALNLEKSGSASGLIYWTGSEFRWYQQGD